MDLLSGGLTALIVIAVIILIVLVSNVKIVPQAYTYIVERLGGYYATWQTGLHFSIPIIDKVSKKINMKELVADFPPQPVITKDNVTMQIDTVILGCTHYPLLLPKIKHFMPDGIEIVSQGEYVAGSLKDYLHRHPEIAAKCTQGGKCTFCTTEAEEKFIESASAFLNEDITVRRVVLE